MKSIVYRRPDGNIDITTPNPAARRVVIRAIVPFFELARGAGVTMASYEDAVEMLQPEWAETEDEFVARTVEKDVPADATDVRVVDTAELPADRTYRNALNPDFTHDMPKAREIHRGLIRAARAPLLAAMDVDYMRADEGGQAKTKAKIAARKQELRDATAHPGIEAAKTIDELKAIWPL